MDKFTFNEELHLYFLDTDDVKKPLTGVTSVLQAIAKPALIQWAANEAVKYVDANLPVKRIGNILEIDADDFKRILDEARTAHRRKKKDAGQKGTDIHAILEQRIKRAIAETEGYIKGHDEGESPQVSEFVEWAITQNVKFFVSEKRVYSKTHWIAGTLDFLCEMDGKKYIGDIKTSSGIYGREYFAQCAGYRLMLEEQGETGFAGSLIVRMGKDGTSEMVISEDYEKDKRLFLACLEVYRTIGTFTEEIKN